MSESKTSIVPRTTDQKALKRMPMRYGKTCKAQRWKVRN